jgi:putative flavoprotein involved in K+ transport
MPVEHVEVLVVGAGQAGVAMSEHLSRNSIPHLVLERARIAEKWRTGRWDSLVANGPAWHDRFPGLGFDDPEAFVGKEAVADYFVAYAEKFAAPIRCGVEVRAVRRLDGRPGFRVETSQGVVEAGNVVAATGPFQRPVFPKIVPESAGIRQLHSADYRNPDQLPVGAVLVVGAGASGAQIAEELLESGRRVFISIGPHDRPPRRYRGRDNVWWLGVLNKWDMAAPSAATRHVTFAVSGAHGGRTVDFRRLAQHGATLLGRAGSFADGVMGIEPGLARNLATGDANYLSVLDEADAWVARNGADLPEEPEARLMLPDPACVTHPILSLDLAAEGITSIVWATGYGLDFGWLKVDAFDAAGKPRHQRGVSSEPGVYFLGLPWLSRRGSSFIWGVWHDASFIADHIAIQRGYRAYRPPAERAAEVA